jgi:hypothetical protein
MSTNSSCNSLSPDDDPNDDATALFNPLGGHARTKTPAEQRLGQAAREQLQSAIAILFQLRIQRFSKPYPHQQ